MPQVYGERFFRIHMDGYAGGYALTVSLNKRWKWIGEAF